ncbi:MAG: 4Fe-4S binding protein, partial [Lachnospiraceae bacterium]|nr:4Fe-4S binding protein [Lachnospiraceae bacterium]
MAEKKGALRKIIQAGWGILTNAYVKGFLPGGPPIYKGKLKQICVPGMNCYSCPGALGACPIGSMQALFDGRQRRFAFYVTGYLAFIGLIAGRFICGWLCLFGLIQELLYKIPTPKLKIPKKIDRPLRYLKYLCL